MYTTTAKNISDLIIDVSNLKMMKLDDSRRILVGADTPDDEEVGNIIKENLASFIESSVKIGSELEIDTKKYPSLRGLVWLKKEFNFVDFAAVSSFIGIDIFTLPLTSQIESLNRYYGYENIFGSSYYEGLTYDEIIKYCIPIPTKKSGQKRNSIVLSTD